jgi:hypothetical protein
VKLVLKISLLLLCVPFVYGAEDKSPSRDGVQWLGSKTPLETSGQFDYVFPGQTSLGNSSYGHVAEREYLVRQLITGRFARAFLIRGGVEWERFEFERANDSFIPQNLNVLNAYLGMDFRFSRKDMIRIQARPGYYNDTEGSDRGDFNYPMAFGYSHMVNYNFQWAAGVSVNRWRNHPYLVGGGFRWQINDRWKVKLMLPEPHIEYKAREDLHLFVGGDFRGDTFRVAPNFGTRRGNPALNNALVDYQELRAGIGFSWNIKPLLELNVHTGYLMDRAFNFHNNAVLLASNPSPYITINLEALFEIWRPKEKEEEPALGTKGKQFEIPDLERVLPNVPKIFEK